ncbi:MAG: hypothetical protein KGM91_21195 [Burkholderiales bacterium]|nr:hypothetical protein [Burkholderiales bacterium]
MNRHRSLAPVPCRRCGAPLGPLQRLRGEACEALDCRRAEVDERLAREREAALQARLRRRTRHESTPALTTAPVIWLQPNRNRLIDIRTAERARYLAQLERVAALAAPEAAEPAADAKPPSDSAIRGRLCAFCAGRCCRYGLAQHAFIDRALLQRWVERHPGSTAQDAAAAYAAQLPRRHVEASCLHHGRDGCTLPRGMRSDICNRFACAGLAGLEQTVAADAPATVVAAMAEGQRLLRVAALDEAGARPLRAR